MPANNFETIDSMSQLTFDEYQKQTDFTAIYGPIGDSTTYPLLGLLGEAGELCNKMKKLWRDGVGVQNELVGCDGEAIRKELAYELGDILWYLARLATELGLSLGQVAVMNLNKLQDRYKRNAIEGSGDSR